MPKLPILRNPAPQIERRIHRALIALREERAEYHRGKLALSEIGGCVRNLWAGVHGIDEDKPIDPRMLVLFEHGNAAETHLVSLLRKAGYLVANLDPETGKQFRVVDMDGTASGRLDGFIRDPTRPTDPWRLLEMKSANDNQYGILEKVGYAEWNPKYADQLQVYMGHARDQLPFKPDEALVVVECKNDSRIHSERIRFDPVRFHALRQRATVATLPGTLPPPKPSEATSQYCAFCKWCVRNEWCWGSTADVSFDPTFPSEPDAAA